MPRLPERGGYGHEPRPRTRPGQADCGYIGREQGKKLTSGPLTERKRAPLWRRGWDSNPRDPFGPNGFQDRRLQPLGHPSGFLILPFRIGHDIEAGTGSNQPAANDSHVSGTKLPEVMVQMLIHQCGPLRRRQRPEEAMRVRGAAIGTGRSKAINQCAQAFLFRCKIAFIRHHKTLRGWRIPAHGLFIPKRFRLRDRSQDPAYKHARRTDVPNRPLHSDGTMCYRLSRTHLAPLTCAVGVQPSDSLFDLSRRSCFVEIFHAEPLLQLIENPQSRNSRERASNAGWSPQGL